MPLLSVIVPVYNEAKTIRKILEKISAVTIDKEVIVVDDASMDGTQAILHDILRNREINLSKVVHHSDNKGKGESVQEGIRQASGEFVVIQDADLEYEPQDYLGLIKPLLEDRADIALGARFSGGHSGLMFHKLGNRFLTGFLNFLFGCRLNDYATCYKMARRVLLFNLELTSKGFEIDVEIICKALKKNLRIVEVPISYSPRTYCEGKKIRWFDGLRAMASILKYRFTN